MLIAHWFNVRGRSYLFVRPMEDGGSSSQETIIFADPVTDTCLQKLHTLPLNKSRKKDAVVLFSSAEYHAPSSGAVL